MSKEVISAQTTNTKTLASCFDVIMSNMISELESINGIIENLYNNWNGTVYDSFVSEYSNISKNYVTYKVNARKFIESVTTAMENIDNTDRGALRMAEIYLKADFNPLFESPSASITNGGIVSNASNDSNTSLLPDINEIRKEVSFALPILPLDEIGLHEIENDVEFMSLSGGAQKTVKGIAEKQVESGITSQPVRKCSYSQIKDQNPIIIGGTLSLKDDSSLFAVLTKDDKLAYVNLADFDLDDPKLDNLAKNELSRLESAVG